MHTDKTKVVTLILFTLLFAILCPQARAHDVSCQEWRQTFSNRLRSAEEGSTDRLLTELIKNKSPQVVLMGESHPNLSEQILYPRLTQLIFNLNRDLRSGPQCIFLEAKSDDFTGRQFYPEVIAAYRKQGFKLLAVDKPSEASIDERSAYIAQQIDVAVKTGACSSGIAFIGKGHLEDVGTGSTSKLVQSSHVTIDIVSTDFNVPFIKDETPMLRMQRELGDRHDIIWRMCPGDSLDLNKVMSDVAAFTGDLTTIPITKMRRMIDGVSDGPFWSTFDLLIVSSPK